MELLPGLELAELTFRLRTVPAAVFVDALRAVGQPLDARGLKHRLEQVGLPAGEVQAAWRRAQPGVKRHGHVRFDGGRYEWSDTPVPAPRPSLTPAQALERLAAGRVPAGLRADLAELVRAALAERDELERRLREVYQASVQARAAQQRQLRIDGARAVAEIAMEVEELASAGAGPAVTVERVRALAKAFDLTPIGRAGDEGSFDPAWHAPIGRHPPDGSAVVIIRPGYSWSAGEHDVLLVKAQVVPVPGDRPGE